MFYRVNMTTASVWSEKEKKYEGLGGSVLSSRILNTEITEDADLLGKHNKLVFAAGLLSGTSAPNVGRMSLGAKSPLTNHIAESNVGGLMGHKLGRLGINGIIIEGLPQHGTMYILWVSSAGISLMAMPALKGLNINSTVIKLQEVFGFQSAIGCIGMAGEHKMPVAGISFTDMQGLPTRHAGKGGLGAVMGSKGIKAIVVNDSDSRQRKFADDILFRTGAQKLTNALLSYFSMNQPFTGQGCSPECHIHCPGEGKNRTRHFFNTYLGVEDFTQIALLSRMYDDYGVDIVELSAAIGIAMKAGFGEFGDSQTVIKMIHELGEATLLGRIIGAGAEAAGKVFGEVNPLKPQGRRELSHEPAVDFIESTGLCKFATPAVMASSEALSGIVEMCNGCYGWNKTFEDYLDTVK